MKTISFSLVVAMAVCLFAIANTDRIVAQQVQQRLAPVMPKQVEPADWETPDGPYKVVMEGDLLTYHTVYSPVDLSSFPKKDRLPIIVMSGPGCEPTGTAFRPFFTELASYGYLVIISGPPSPQGNAGPLPKTTKEDMLASIDWAFAENSRTGNKFYGKIDTSNVCAMGQSCGGIQVLDISNDPRITLLTMWNSGLFAAINNNAFNSLSRDKAILGKLRQPIAYFVGDTDMARPNAEDDFGYITGVPVFVAVRAIPGDAHGGTFREHNGGGFGVAGVAWVQWNMKNDKNAAKMFKGDPCGLAKDPKWIEIKKNKID
jgi:hypothetical protein